MKRYFYIPSDFADSVVVGAIIGIVEIVDCVETHPSAHFRKIEDAKKTYGFVLANPIPLPFPIQIKGQQKFWNVPTEVEKQIRKQLKGKWDGTA